MSNIIEEVIESYNMYLEKLIFGCDKIVELLNEERIEEALNSIANFSEGIMWMIEVKQHLINQDIVVDFNQNKIMSYFKEINEGLELKDYVLVSDLLEYEIIPFLHECSPIEYKA